MARMTFVIALGIAAATQPALASQPDPATIIAAPAGSAATRYCLKVGPVTGRMVETVECWTRAEWAEQDVDVDKEWAKEGVRVIG